MAKARKGGGKRVERTILVAGKGKKHCLHRVCGYESRRISSGRDNELISNHTQVATALMLIDWDLAGIGRYPIGPDHKAEAHFRRPYSDLGTPANRGDNAQYATVMEENFSNSRRRNRTELKSERNGKKKELLKSNGAKKGLIGFRQVWREECCRRLFRSSRKCTNQTRNRG